LVLTSLHIHQYFTVTSHLYLISRTLLWSMRKWLN
jgi:hypothetical protein